MEDNQGRAQAIVSIITITYNAVETLERTIESVEAQDYRAIEYIVVDGGSTDGTMQVVGRHATTVGRCISEPDDGLYYAMNKGLKLATGEYVWFLNAGDELNSPDTVSRVMASATGADVYYGDTVITAMDGSVIGKRRLAPPEVLTAESFRDGMLVCHQAFIARRSLCPQYDTRYKYSADYDWCVKILKSARKIVNTHETLVRFLDGGVTSSHIVEGLKERFAIMRQHFGTAGTVMKHIPIGVKFLWFWATRGRF